MSNVWFTSDLHIGHAKVASIRATEQMITRQFTRNDCGLFEPDPAHDIRWHDAALALWWDHMVHPDDVVHVLGDISSGTDSAQRNALEWISKRPGRKRLKAGNHDRPHDMYRDNAKWMPAYWEVFEDVRANGRMRIPVTGGYREVLLSHFPYVGDREVERHTQWRLKNEGLPILHGHIHSGDRVTYAGGSMQIHVGLDAWDMKPVPLSAISALMEPTGVVA